MTRPRVLITGASGWTGGHVLRAAPHDRWRVFGVSRTTPGVDGAESLPVDLERADEVQAVVHEVRPAVTLHLAALTPAGAAWTDGAPDANLRMATHLLDALASRAPGSRVLVASSAAVYGDPRADSVHEDTPAAPATAYGASKLAIEHLARHYGGTGGLQIVILRPFNQTGPGEPAGQVCSTIARQLAAIEAGRQPPELELQSLAPSRDFVDVRDVARAYWAAVDRGLAGEAYNVCSGTAHTIGDVVRLLLDIAHVGPIHVVERDPGAGAAPAFPAGSSARLTAATGWRPSIPLVRSLSDLLEGWRTAAAP